MQSLKCYFYIASHRNFNNTEKSVKLSLEHILVSGNLIWGRTKSRTVSEENKNTPKAGYVLEAPWWQLRFACTLSCLFSGFTTDWLEGGGWVFIWKKLQYKLLPFQKNHRCKFLWQNTHESVLPARYRTVMIHWAFIWFLKADILLKDEIIYCCSEAHKGKGPQMPTFGVGGGALRSVSKHMRLLNVMANDTYAQTTVTPVALSSRWKDLALRNHTLLYQDMPRWPADFIFTWLLLDALICPLFPHMILMGLCT